MLVIVGYDCKYLRLVQFIIEMEMPTSKEIKKFISITPFWAHELMCYIIMLRMLALQNLIFSLCICKKSIKYSQTLIIPI